MSGMPPADDGSLQSQFATMALTGPPPPIPPNKYQTPVKVSDLWNFQTSDENQQIKLD